MNEEELQKHVYDKEITCPVCGSTFKVQAVKVNSPRISSKDSDFFIRYSIINPYFYDVWICNSCGYSAMKTDFDKIKSYQKDLVKNLITSKWKPHYYPRDIQVDDAINKYKLALITATSIQKSNSTLAMILLKMSWMYRLKKNHEKEIRYLSIALKQFKEAYSKEDFPIYGMQRDSITYLIGELYRRTNNNEEALKWYSQVIATIGASQKVKELARDGRDIINESHNF